MTHGVSQAPWVSMKFFQSHRWWRLKRPRWTPRALGFGLRHPRKQRWNLKIAPWKRSFHIYKPAIFGFRVCFFYFFFQGVYIYIYNIFKFVSDWYLWYLYMSFHVLNYISVFLGGVHVEVVTIWLTQVVVCRWIIKIWYIAQPKR